jgi:eukaryotic-like serine/threonine-protein kinase
MNDASPEMLSIFAGAIERPSPGERAAFLDTACGSDVELRRRIEALLRAHDKAGGFLGDRPVARDPVATIDQPASEGPGSVVGPYKLLEQIGEGGFGVVFMAEQTAPVRRKVALKVLKPGMDTRPVVARFEAERQALALMDHPNIARVFDGGVTPSVRPYFVMELVKGVPVTDFCDHDHLTPHQRLELFVQVCGAVQHAHQKGIIHRDLKPSNVLVTVRDTVPVVKVIDFGIAKALGQELTDKTLFTGFAQMVGTPLYMSPEQAGQSGLDIDTRSDIYSLGVLLYELLTGTTPFTAERFKRAAYDEIRRIIREEEPPRPSTRLSESKDKLPSISALRHMEPAKLTKLVKGELDWIVMKALEKDRSRRYETANGFAVDVERFLADEPVLACPPSAAYRLRKFARRNRRSLVTAAVVVLALLIAVGSIAGSIGWTLRDEATRRAQAAEKADQALQEARHLQGQARWREARAAVKRAQALLGGSADAGRQRRVEELLADLTMAESLEDINLDQAAVREELFDLAQADLAYARAFRDYGIDIDALPTEDAAERIKGRAIRAALVAALDDWALVRKHTRKPNRGRPLAAARAADPDDRRDQLREALRRADRETLKKLAASARGSPLPGPTLLLLADALRSTGATEDALALLRQAQQRCPGDFWINHTLATHLYNRRQWEGAVRYLTAAAALRPDSPIVQVNLGSALHGKGDLDGACAAYRRAAALKPDYAMPHYNLGLLLKDRGRLNEAIAEWRKAVQIRPDFVWAQNNIGKAWKDLGRPDKALAAYRETIRLWRKVVADEATRPDDRGNLGGALDTLGVLLLDKGELREAVRLFEEAVVHQQAALKANHEHPKYRRFLRNHYLHLAQVHLKLGDHAGAARAAAELPRLFPSDWLESYRAVDCLVRCAGLADKDTKLPGSRRKELARAYAEQVREHVREAIERGRESPKALDAVAWFLANDPGFRDPHRAVELAHRAVELAPGEAEYWATLGAAQYRAGNRKAAVGSLRKATELGKGGGAVPFFLAMAHRKLGHENEARNWYDKASQWMDRFRPNDEELSRFRAEAAELLSGKVKKD